MGIITKALKHIGITAVENYSFILTDLVSDNQGIYALYKGDDLYYIGKATDLKRRISQHLKDRHCKKWDKFSLFVVQNEKHINDLESLLITICEPVGNRAHPKGKAKDLQKDFRDRIKAYRADQDALLFGPRKLTSIALQAVYKGKTYTAQLLKDNAVRYKGTIYSSPSAAARAITQHATNGLLFWKTKKKNGELICLKKLS